MKKLNVAYILFDFPIASETWISLEIAEMMKRDEIESVTIIRTSKGELSKEVLSGVDFALVHFANTASSAVAILEELKIPFGFVAHARDIWVDNGQMFKHTARSGMCKFIGSVSRYHREKYIEWGVDEKKIIYWPNCVNVELFKRVGPIGKKIICGGRHVEKKGLKYAISAVPDITVFGSGPLTEELMQISPKASFVGWLTPAETKELMNDSYLLIAPSIVTDENDTEGLSTLVCEALAMSMQVLTTNVAGHRELVGVDGVTIIDNVHNVASAVLRVPRVASRGRSWVMHTHNPQNVVTNLIGKMHEVI